MVKDLTKRSGMCVINGYKTMKYFMVGRGTCQGDSSSAFLLFFALEVLFLSVKTKPEIAELIIFDRCFLDSTYSDDTTLYHFFEIFG